MSAARPRISSPPTARLLASRSDLPCSKRRDTAASNAFDFISCTDQSVQTLCCARSHTSTSFANCDCVSLIVVQRAQEGPFFVDLWIIMLLINMRKWLCRRSLTSEITRWSREISNWESVIRMDTLCCFALLPIAATFSASAAARLL